MAITLFAGPAAHAQSQTTASPAEITIGVRAHLGHETAVARWQPTLDYLAEQFPDTAFHLKTYDSPESIEQAAATREFDYVITDPGSFAVMDVLHGVEERLTLINAWDGRPVTRFGSVVFTRAGGNAIETFKDLAGHSLMAVSPKAFGGWFVALRALRQAGLDPARDLRRLTFAAGNQQDVVRAVMAGQVDAGVVRTGTLERMARQGLIDMDEVRIIAPRSVPGFPFHVSTRLYPEWVFAESPPHQRTAFRSALLAALTRLTPDHPAAIAGSYAGWQAAADYWPVHVMLRELNAPPYDASERASFKDAVRANPYRSLLTALALLGVFGVLLSRLGKQSVTARRLARDARMADAEVHLYREALDRHAIVSLCDPDGIITHVNDRFIEISGFSRDEIVGQPQAILHTDLVAPQVHEEMWATLRRGEIWRGEMANRRKDGGIWWAQTTVAPRRSDAGEITGHIMIWTDVTALKASQAEMNLRQYFNAVPGEVLQFRVDTHEIFFCNDAAQRVTGLSEADLCGRTLSDFLCEDDAARLREQLRALTEGQVPSVACVGERIMPDGRRIETSFHIQYLRPQGTEPCFVATLHDISDEADIRRKVIELSTTLDTVDDQIFMFWPDSKRLFYANQAAKAAFGLTDDEIRQMTLTDLKGGPSCEECTEILRPMLEGETDQVVLRRDVTAPDGTPRVVEYDIRHVQPQGRKPRFIAILRDRTDQAEKEHELQQLRSSLDLLDEEFYMFWPESYALTYMNRRALERSGWGSEGWRGRTVQDILSDRQMTWLEEKCTALLEGPEKSMVFETSDRNNRVLEIRLHLIEPENAPPRFLSIYRDVTERKQAEIAKSQFLSTVTHELRTPLTSIKGSLGLLQAGIHKMEPERVSRMLDIAGMNVDRLHALINDILDWEKIEAGEMSYACEETDLCAALREAVELNQGYARQHGVTFRLSVPRKPVICEIDKMRIQQVIANLLSNAAKFSGEGTTVEIALQTDGAEAEVSVRDHGEGIPEPARATIFNRFTQADSSDVRRRGGTGLGLSISKAIVEAHDGTIGFDCPEDGGTRFHFRLPLKSPTGRSDRPGDTGQDRPPRVVIGDHDPEAGHELWQALEMAGMKCSIAHTMAELAEQVGTAPVDCLVLNRALDPALDKWIASKVQYRGLSGDGIVFYSADSAPRDALIATVLREVRHRLHRRPQRPAAHRESPSGKAGSPPRTARTTTASNAHAAAQT